MSKKEKVFSVFAKIALVFNTIFLVVAILNFVTSFVALIPYVGTFINVIKTPFVSAASTLSVPGFVFSILGFFGNKKIARKALTRSIVGIVFTFLAVVVTFVLAIASSAIVAFLISVFYMITEEAASSYYMLFM